jgi:hypothetical protein
VWSSSANIHYHFGKNDFGLYNLQSRGEYFAYLEQSYLFGICKFFVGNQFHDQV